MAKGTNEGTTGDRVKKDIEPGQIDSAAQRIGDKHLRTLARDSFPWV